MARFLQIAIPAVSFVLMGLVGLSLTVDGLAAALRNRRALGAGIVFPWLLSPLLGWLCVRLVPLPGDLQLGLLLVAACPVGGIANVHALLARANGNLSVTLTAISCLLSWGLTPAILRLLSASPAAAVPLGTVVLQVGLLLILPALLGLAIRRRMDLGSAESERLLARIGTAGVSMLLVLAILSSPGGFAEALRLLALPVVAFTLAALAAGAGLGRLFRLGPDDRVALVFQFPAKNLSVASVLAVTVLGRLEFAAFGAAFFLLQTPLLLAVAGLRRWRTAVPQRE